MNTKFLLSLLLTFMGFLAGAAIAMLVDDFHYRIVLLIGCIIIGVSTYFFINYYVFNKRR
ncbi:hypothetical protein LYSBPC_04410 [Lysinibacillus piscis]|uniref:Uncharacterized protein n=1 Tax=Lysinibacillus piscis TaxID=2518931 RepID=A0ABQ5NGA6_9BACI|nr:hypothetical protein LYSBPC_04410 [Lysinibacillus sp. KH24]